MIIEFKGRKRRIPDNELEKLKKGLGLTEEEAVQVWLEDNEDLINEEQEALDRKANKERITQVIHQAKKESKQKTQKERVQKENPTKERIIAKLAEILPQYAENVIIANKNKLITFTVGEKSYTLDLVEHRTPKK